MVNMAAPPEGQRFYYNRAGIRLASQRRHKTSLALVRGNGAEKCRRPSDSLGHFMGICYNRVWTLCRGSPAGCDESRCSVSQAQTTRPSDPLASLRIDRSRARPRSGWFTKAVPICLALGLIGAGAAWAWQRYGETLTSPQVKVAAVEARVPGDADSVLTAQGYLKSEKQAAIGAKVAGRVLRVYVKEGQPVEKNALLAELEHGDIDESLEAMKASLDAQESSLEAIRASLDKAKAEVAEVESNAAQDERDFARAEALFRTRSIAASDFETARSKHVASVNRRVSMTAAVAIAQSRLREA